MFVKPKSGLLILDPSSRAVLPEEGQEVSSADSYWVRRVRDGDVEVVEQTNPVRNNNSGENV
jgi:hypothetical protein